MPMLGHTTATFSIIESSISMDDDFFSVAMTMPFDATENEERIGGYYYEDTFNPKTCGPL